MCSQRFLLTFGEALVGDACMLSDLRHRASACCCTGSTLLRHATETWVAALASAPMVLMYPLFLVIFGRSAWTIIMMGFVAGAAAGDPEDPRRPVRHAARC